MKSVNVLGVLFIKISLIAYCFGNGSFEKILNGYKPEINLPNDEVLYLRGIPLKMLEEVVRRSKDLVEQKAENAKLLSEKNVIELESENYRLSCTFTKGRKINEALFKNITDYEKVEYGKQMHELFAEGGKLMKSGIVHIPEDLSIYPDVEPSVWKKCKTSFFTHWVQYFDKCPLKSASTLKKFLKKKYVDYHDFGWSMSKTYTVFCAYVHTGTPSAKFMDTTSGYQQYIYLDLIKQYNNWILTTRDLKNLDLAAEFTGNFKIDNFEWFDKKKNLAIPILKHGNPLITSKCPAIVEDDKYVVAAPLKN